VTENKTKCMVGDKRDWFRQISGEERGLDEKIQNTWVKKESTEKRGDRRHPEKKPVLRDGEEKGGDLWKAQTGAEKKKHLLR